MKNKFKRLLSCLSTIVLIITALPTTALSAIAEELKEKSEEIIIDDNDSFNNEMSLSLDSLTLDSYPAILAQNDDIAYDFYLADYLLSSEHAQSYINRDYYIPYRKYVEDRKNSDVYQGLLTAWNVATFNGSTNGLKKSVVYYETILYDTFFGGVEGNSSLNDISSSLSSIKAGSMKTMMEYFETLDDELMKDELKDVDFSNLKNDGNEIYVQALNHYLMCDSIRDVYGSIAKLKDYVDKCKDFAEVIEKVSKVKALSDKYRELQIIITDISSNTDDTALKVACTNINLILDDILDEIILDGVFVVEDAAWEISDKVFKGVWTVIINDLTGVGIAVKAGQVAGKLSADLLFSTERDIECVHSMTALYNMENIMVNLVKTYQSRYRTNSTDLNARVYTESFKVLMKVFVEGIDYSKKYAKIATEEGVFNQIFKRFENKDYKQLLSMLDSMRTTYEGFIHYVDCCVYYNYLAGIPNSTHGIKIKKNIKNAETSSVTGTDIALYFEDYKTVDTLYTNHFVNNNWKLTSDFHTYGNLYIYNNIDLNGFTMTIDGDVYQKSGNIKINNGRFNISNNYYMEDTTTNSIGEIIYNGCGASITMQNQMDKIFIGGNFTTHSIGTEAISLAYGTFAVAGDIWSDNGFYCNGQNSKVYLNGNSNQKVHITGKTYYTVTNFGTVDYYGYYFNALEVENPENRKIIWSGNLGFLQLLSDINIESDNMNLMKCNLNGHNMSINGNVTKRYDEKERYGYLFDLNGGSLTINGNFLHTGGSINVNNGRLTINGDYTMENAVSNNVGEIIYNSCSASLNMTNQYDKAAISGDFTMHKASSKFEYGVLSIGGDLWTDGGMYTSKSHNLNLNGTKNQKVYIGGDSSIYDLSVVSPLKRKITWSGNLVFNKLNSDIYISADNLTLNSFDLNLHNMTIDGNVSGLEKININGGNLTIIGNLLHNAGTINVNNGSFNIYGNYTMENAISNNIGEIVYNSCSASLNMSNQYDKVNVYGDFITHNLSSGNVKLNNGVLRISGNVWSDSGISTTTNNGHKTILTGNGKQSVTLGSSNKFNILALTKPINNYTFTPEKCWNTLKMVESGSGDCNLDGEVTVADAVMLQKWLLCSGDLTCWQAADICADERIDVFDLVLLKRMILAQTK